ncbi:MAG: ABC transporter ATP-binding protein [Clostridia bacterium]|nr:ABC transporter ATP-binding protein [Clostridia bacterium]
MSKSREKAERGTLKKVLRLIRPYRLLVALSILCSAVTVALTLYVPVLIGRTIDLIIGPGQVDMPGIMRLLLRIGWIIVVTAAVQWVVNTINNRITYQVVRDVRDSAFRHLQILPLRYIDAHPVGGIVSRIIADVDQFADGLLMGFTQLFTGVVTILGTLIFMISIRPGIAAVVVLLTPLSFVVARFIATHTYSYFRQQSETRGEQTAFIDEMLGGQKVVKAFGQEQECIERFDEINGRLAKCALKAIFYSSLTNPCTRFVNNVVYAGVALSGALLCVATAGAAVPFTVGSLSALLSYANQYTKPFNEISGVVTELQNALACASRVFKLIAEPAQTPDDDDARVLEAAEGAVRLQDVAFSYTQDRKLIEDLNLDVHPGQRVAIVGPTGCGKTTLINLLMRFYDVDRGSISVEGTDIRHITRRSLRANYGMVLQETWLKAGTVRENLVMGKPDATDDEIIAAAKAAHAHGFIKRLPQGYDTVIGEDGGSLSQGQKQLLCIARIMLCLPPMLILDEATSSIDTRTEIRIQQAFDAMMAGRTTFVVAHRLSTIREADVILVMRDGHIVEMGNHEELLKKDGFYAKLYNSQFAA